MSSIANRQHIFVEHGHMRLCVQFGQHNASYAIITADLQDRPGIANPLGDIWQQQLRPHIDLIGRKQQRSRVELKLDLAQGILESALEIWVIEHTTTDYRRLTTDD